METYQEGLSWQTVLLDKSPSTTVQKVVADYVAAAPIRCHDTLALLVKEVRFWGLLLGLFVCLGAVIPLVSKADVFDTAPAGLNLEGLFEPGKFDRNSATMQTVSKNGHSQHVIELTNDDNQVGAMWSTPVNRFNMRVDNQVSMWVNFGDKAVSEGLAVVLQNSPGDTIPKNHRHSLWYPAPTPNFFESPS
ncbi:hypothetical protein WP50_37750 [Lactiplantibacillus plantarum]|nr:hypothetical protein WP50_37750 [Lactiplantibacillus plantarum]